MAFTSHGHQIIGSPAESRENVVTARCGGPHLCEECTRDAEAWVRNNLHLTTEYESQADWQNLARQIVFDWIYEGLGGKKNHPTFSKGEVYVVWWCFTLGNWKALISTTLPGGRYYEVTYNREKSEVYLDTYRKTHNQAIPIVAYGETHTESTMTKVMDALRVVYGDNEDAIVSAMQNRGILFRERR